jgi:UDP-3-O-[3-hydroxymyristoyl] N-acetylglucosamine deacetylase
MLRRQRTLGESIVCYGMGLHSGLIVNMTLRPLPPGSGVVFQRLDLEGRPRIRATYENISGTNMATSLACGGAEVRTVEHLLAVCAGLGIDNVLVQLDAPEVPILDGSAAPFIYLIKQAGIVEQSGLQPCLRVKKQVQVEQDDKSVAIFPSERTEVFCTIDFDHPLIGEQHSSYIHDEESFCREIGPARTFGFKSEVDYLHRNGLAKGGSLDNAVVVDEYRVLNEEGLRYRDEFVRHKVLDSLGDLFLAGFPLLGRFVGVKSGHNLNCQLIQRLMSDSAAWELVTSEEGLSHRASAGFAPPLTDPVTA